MVSSIYLLSIFVSCCVIMQVYSSVAIDNRYSPWLDASNSDEQEPSQNDEQLHVAQRAVRFIFPPTSIVHPSNQFNAFRDLHAIKRQSFGRKHHWDAFFGRR